jgi:hypothetical protein
MTLYILVYTLLAGNTNPASRWVWQQQSLCQLSSFFTEYNYVDVLETHILCNFSLLDTVIKQQVRKAKPLEHSRSLDASFRLEYKNDAACSEVVTL